MILNADKQTRNFFLYACFSALFFETSIMTLYMQGKGQSLSSISMLVGIYSIGVFVFEYLTGIVADRFNRKSVLVLSTVFLVFGEVALIIGSNFTLLMIGFLLISVSVAAKSGADIALIYDYMKERQKEESFGKLMSIMGSSCMVLSAVSAFIGPLLLSKNIELPLIATIVSALCSLFFLLQLEDSRKFKPKRSFKGVFRNSFNELCKSSSTLAVLLFSVVFYPCYHVLTWMLQPYLIEMDFKLHTLSYFFLGFALIQAVGARMSNKLDEKFGWRKCLFASALGISIVFIILSMHLKALAIFAIVIAGLSFGLFYTVNTVALNRHIGSDLRASTLSLQHGITKVSQMFAFALIGLGVEYFSLKTVFMFYGILLISVLALLGKLYNVKEQNDSNVGVIAEVE